MTSRIKTREGIAVHDLYSSTKGVLFFGTPHLGTDHAAFHQAILNICNIFTRTNNKLVTHLIPGSEVLQQIQSQYVDISRGLADMFFFEQYSTRIFGGFEALVRSLFMTEGTHLPDS